jgi:hypothetical protein
MMSIVASRMGTKNMVVEATMAGTGLNSALCTLHSALPLVQPIAWLIYPSILQG